MTFTTRVRAAAAFNEKAAHRSAREKWLNPAAVIEAMKEDRASLQPLLELLGLALDALAETCKPEPDGFGDFVADEFTSAEVLRGRIFLARAEQILDSRIANSEGEGK